jgi:hypothetical protein
MEREAAALEASPAVEEESNEIPMCPSCGQRPCWVAHRLPICEVCRSYVPAVEMTEYWRALDAAMMAPDMPAATRAAKARLVRATRVR